MRQISKIHFTSKGEVSNYFNFLKKFELRTERSIKINRLNEWVFIYLKLTNLTLLLLTNLKSPLKSISLSFFFMKDSIKF